VTLRGAIGDQEQSFNFPADFVGKSDDDTNAFVAKLWATRRVGEIIDELDLKGKNDELIAELVALATEHGILTPYTSFLADETSDVRAVTRNLGRAAMEVEALSVAEGAWGFRQRELKAGFQMSNRAPAAATLVESGAIGAGGRFYNNVRFYDSAKDEQVAARNIRQVGRKTFFQRGEQWIDATVTEDEEKHARKLERYSSEYFALIARHGQHVAQYLALDAPVTVKLAGVTYQW
jgi:Ca-activated chloride channel family protein